MKTKTEEALCPSHNSGYTPLKRRIAAERYMQCGAQHMLRSPPSMAAIISVPFDTKKYSKGDFIMKRLVFILSIIGGLIGIFNNALFFVCGSIGSSLFGTTSSAGERQTAIIVNAIMAFVFCITAMVAGGLFYSDSKKEQSDLNKKYTAVVLLVFAAIGLGLTFSYVTLIIIGVSAIIALIAVIPEFKADSSSGSLDVKKALIIPGVIGVIVMIAISLYSFNVIDLSKVGMPSQYSESSDVTDKLVNFIKTEKDISGEKFNKAFAAFKFKSVKISGNVSYVSDKKDNITLSLPNEISEDDMSDTALWMKNVSITFHASLKNKLTKELKSGDQVTIKGVLSKGTYDHTTGIISSSRHNFS
ncbi:MAG TPA: hypothetical protein P5239_01780, partial [Victivallales bacterium]|nr:hypothetical protein [Victivallales bacterium]